MLVGSADARAIELSVRGPSSLPAAKTLSTALKRKGLTDLRLIVRTHRQNGQLQLTVRIYHRDERRLAYYERIILRWKRLTGAEARQIASRVWKKLAPRPYRPTNDGEIRTFGRTQQFYRREKR